jgi:hypothetical protein
VIALQLPRPQGRALEVLVVGAHADDIEIGCGGTVLHLAAGGFRYASPGWCWRRRASASGRRSAAPQRS